MRSTRICRTENGRVYGDTIDRMDFPYLRKVTQLNVAALAALARAPMPPEPVVKGAVSTDTTLTWRASTAPSTMSFAGGDRLGALGAGSRLRGRCRPIMSDRTTRGRLTAPLPAPH